MTVEVPVLSGRFVRLEPLAEEHRDGLRAAGDDDRVWEYLTVLGRGAEFDRWFDEAMIQRDVGKRVPFAVRLLATGELVGSTGYFDPQPAHKRVQPISTRLWAGWGSKYPVEPTSSSVARSRTATVSYTHLTLPTILLV